MAVTSLKEPLWSGVASALMMLLIPAAPVWAQETPAHTVVIAPPTGAVGPPPRSPVITNPRWAAAPAPLYPELAFRRGYAEGAVRVRCGVSSDGRLRDCVILEETPSDGGFGAAALEAARSARLSPRDIDGAARDATVTFPILFRLQ